MLITFEGAYATSGGTTVTDRMQITVTVNPGTVTSRVNSNMQYFPNSGGFKSRKYFVYALCTTTSQCGINSNSPLVSPSTSSTEHYVSHTSRSGGKALIIAVGVRLSTIANTVANGAKTRACYGRSGGDHRCFYK